MSAINTKTTDVTYNNESFLQDVFIIRYDDTKSESKYVQPIFNNIIRRIEIVSDIETYTYTGNILIVDTDRSLVTKIIPDGFSHIKINIQRSFTDKKGETRDYELNRTYIITNIKILDKENNQFVIEFSSLDWLAFNNRLEYATGEAKSGTKIIQELFSNSGLTLESSNKSSEYKQAYITPTNYSFKDTLDDILGWTIDSSNSIFVVYYNHNTEKYYMNSINEMLSEETVDSNNLTFVGTNREGLLPGQFTMNKIDLSKLEDFKTIIDQSSEIKVFGYDYKERKFTEKIIERSSINSHFPKPWDEGRYSNRFKNAPKIGSIVQTKYIEKLSNDFKENNNYRDLFYMTESLAGYTTGVLTRHAGQLMFINLDEETQMYYRFLGVWFVKRVVHLFQEEKYFNNIQLCRTDEIVELEKQTFDTSKGKEVTTP